MPVHEDIGAKRTAAIFICAVWVLDWRQVGKNLSVQIRRPAASSCWKSNWSDTCIFELNEPGFSIHSFWVGMIPQRRNLWSDECQVDEIQQCAFQHQLQTQEAYCLKFNRDGDIWLPIPAPRIWRQMQPRAEKYENSGWTEQWTCGLWPTAFCALKRRIHIRKESSFPKTPRVSIMHELLKWSPKTWR